MNENPKNKITPKRNSLTLVLHGMLSLILLIFMVNNFFQTELDLTAKIMMSLFIVACEVIFLASGMTSRTWSESYERAWGFVMAIVALMITVLFCSTAYRVDFRADLNTLWILGSVFLLPVFTAYEMFLFGKAIAANQISANEKGKSKPSQVVQADAVDNTYNDFIEADEQLSQSDDNRL